MTVTRTEPPFILDERPMLESWLEYHRATLAHKCEGLSTEQLRQRAVPPSSISLLGLMRHMAEVEAGWFRAVLAGEVVVPHFYSESDPDGDFDNVDDADPEEAFTLWREECDRARSIAAAAPSLDFVGAELRRGEQVSLRWVLVHMIEEYACHNGHADFLRERIDGTVGD